jgi:hypothetical protein
MNCRHCYGIGYDASGYPCTCAPVKVAKVARRMPGDKPLPANPWRAYLGHVAKWLLIAVASMLIAAVVLLTRWLP